MVEQKPNSELTVKHNDSRLKDIWTDGRHLFSWGLRRSTFGLLGLLGLWGLQWGVNLRSPLACLWDEASKAQAWLKANVLLLSLGLTAGKNNAEEDRRTHAVRSRLACAASLAEGKQDFPPRLWDPWKLKVFFPPQNFRPWLKVIQCAPFDFFCLLHFSEGASKSSPVLDDVTKGNYYISNAPVNKPKISQKPPHGFLVYFSSLAKLAFMLRLCCCFFAPGCKHRAKDADFWRSIVFL